MNPADRSKRLPGDEHWPATHYTLYAENLEGGEPGKLLCSRHVMSVYRDSLIRFYLACSGSERFPRLPKRNAQLSDLEQAEDVVHDYFAKRAEELVPKWLHFRSEQPGSSPIHLRAFIKQDFRYHCLEALRSDHRFHRRARPLEADDHQAADVLPETLQRETTELEVKALVQVAIDLVLDTFPENERDELRVLVENRILRQRRYQEFESDLHCSLQSARQKVVRFRRKLIPIVRDLIRQQGDSLEDLIGDLS